MLVAEARRGKEQGVRLKPHKFSNGKFKVSEYKGGPSKWLSTEEEIKTWLKRGWSLRMSNVESQYHRAPSLIVPRHIRGWL